MRKLNLFLLFMAVSSLIVCVFLAKAILKKNPALVLSERSLTDTALSLFDEELNALTSQQIALQQAEITAQLLKVNEQTAKSRVKIEAIPFWEGLWQRTVTGILLTLAACSLLASGGFGWAALRHRSLVTQQLSEHTILNIHYRTVKDPQFALFAAKMTEIERVRAQFPETALKLSMGLMHENANVVKALHGGRSRTIDLLPTDDGLLALPPVKSPVPTFQELLESGDIAPGKPMILGYDQNRPRQGGFIDIYSSAIAGESGSGKTSTQLFLIGSGLVACQARFYGIDPHYPHPKSLGFKTKPLWEAGLMRMATQKDDMLDVLSDIERIIDLRLKQIDTDQTPVVLVIDELAFLNKTTLGEPLAHTMERISTEGRKCQVYMLASSQTWLVSRTGKDSVVRDTLTSAYVHRIKPKQANLLLQDKEQVDQLKKHVKKPGEVLFCPTNDEPVVFQMPYTTERDMQLIVDLFYPERIAQVANGQPVMNGFARTCKVDNGKNRASPAECEIESMGDNVGQHVFIEEDDRLSCENDPVDTVENLRQNVKKLTGKVSQDGQKLVTQAELCRLSGIDTALMSKFLHGQDCLSTLKMGDLQQALQGIDQPCQEHEKMNHTVIPFRSKK